MNAMQRPRMPFRSHLRHALWVGCALAALAGCGAKSDDAAPVVTALTVQLVAPQQRSWPDTVTANGALTAWQEVVVSTETGPYRVVDLAVDVGAHVRRGQVLARLAADKLEADLRKQQAALDQSAAALRKAQAEVRRYQAAADSGALSAQQIEEATLDEASQRAALASAQAELDNIRLQLSQTRLVAADDGVVSSRSGVLGQVVAAGTEVYRLVRDGRVEWRAELDARQLALVPAGATAQVLLPGGRRVAGTVRLVAPTLNGNTGRGLVYVSLPASSGAQAGGYAEGQLVLRQRQALTLPESALVQRDGRGYVFTLDARQRATQRAVSTGRRRDGEVEILDGVTADEQVVAAGGSFLSEGAPVTVVAASAPGAGAGTEAKPKKGTVQP